MVLKKRMMRRQMVMQHGYSCPAKASGSSFNKHLQRKDDWIIFTLLTRLFDDLPPLLSHY